MASRPTSVLEIVPRLEKLASIQETQQRLIEDLMHRLEELEALVRKPDQKPAR